MSIDGFQENVLATIDRWHMLPEQSHVGVAVSGGADSVALFRTLHSLAAQRRWRLFVLHVNHKLRGIESDEDQAFVQLLADQHDTPFDHADLPPPPGGNLEEEARLVRRAWLQRCTILHNLDRIATGHTRSDQAETVLFRFLRGSGSAGLAAIRPVTVDGFVRPLLGIGRAEVRAQLCTIGQPWREDSSNVATRFDRNRIRLELLPALARDWNPSIETTLAQTAEWARAEEEYWDGIVATLARDYLRLEPGPAVIALAGSLASLPAAAARRLLRHAIALVKGDLRSVDYAHVEQIRSLCTQTEGSGRLQIPGIDAFRSFDRIRLAPPGAYGGDRHWSVTLEVPGQIPLPGSNFLLKSEVLGTDNLYNETGNCFDRNRVAGSLELRTWQPGDQYRPVGHSNVVKLKTLFQDARIPLWERRTWPVLVQASGGAIVWTRQFGVAADYAANSGTTNAVILSERPAGNGFPKPESGTERQTSIDVEDPIFGLPHEAETE